MSDDIDLISLAAWLHREARAASKAANSATEPYGALLSQQDAARFGRASEIVKEAADRQRMQRSADQGASRPNLRKS